MDILSHIGAEQTVLIAGPTASGKSSLALAIAERAGGVILNADALQVFDGWHILTARPSQADLNRARHALYGHVSYRDTYSTGQWLRDVTPFLAGRERAIIVGGTGLNFTALTEGLAPIPATPPHVRETADAMGLNALRDALDDMTRNRIDTANRARVQRAWEVQQATGRSITDWQAETPPPLLPPADAVTLVLNAQTSWLETRIIQRFDQMLANGVLDEVTAMRGDWNPARPSSRAIGARALISYLNGDLTRETARSRAIIASRQYAKRQRTWFRARMKNWRQVDAQNVTAEI